MRQQFGPLRYDEFAHMMIRAGQSSIVWLVRTHLKRGHHLPVKLTAFFAATTVLVFQLLKSSSYGIGLLSSSSNMGTTDTATDLQLIYVES